MLRKLFYILFFVSALLLTQAQNVQAQACIPNYQSCDASNPCCDLATFQCNEGYCTPKTATCGGTNQPCCEAPNPQCNVSGLQCQGGYCVLPATPPTCGTIHLNCCAGNICNGSGLECVAGICVPPVAQPSPSPPSIPPAGDGITCLDGNGINTAIGCIPISDTNQFIGFVLGWAIGIGGGIAFILIVYSSFIIMTSSGNPERLKAGQELLTSAISGLIMLVFSLFILELIGVKILNIPGFTN